MGRVYDIVDRIANANQRPVLKIDEDHKFKINNSFAATIAIKAVSEDKKIDDMVRIKKILKISLSDEANEYIESQDYPTPVYQLFVEVIMAAVADVDLEEIEDKVKENTPSK